jgi:hypothetical protein
MNPLKMGVQNKAKIFYYTNTILKKFQLIDCACAAKLRRLSETSIFIIELRYIPQKTFSSMHQIESVHRQK